MTLQYFITREAGEQPRQYEARVNRILQAFDEQGLLWSEQPALRGCFLLSVGHGPNRPFAYIEYPK